MNPFVPENEDADPVGPIDAAAPKQAPQAASPKPRNLDQEKTDFTSEGAPPPGQVSGASAPATLQRTARTQRPRDAKR